jgi:fibronectin type 3 domain-containing protein
MKKVILFIGIMLWCIGYAQAVSVTLAWDYTQGSDLATQFKVYSQISTTCSGTWGVIAIVSVPTQGYTDSMLSAGLTYCYQVTALDNAGLESMPSNVVMFQVLQGPQAPSNLHGFVR